MDYEKYENWVKRQQENAVIWKKKGISVPNSENYPVEVRRWVVKNPLGKDVNKIAIRMKGHLVWWIFENKTIKEIETMLLSGIPYIKNIQFYEMMESPIII